MLTLRIVSITALAALALSSCTTVPPGVVSVEARGSGYSAVVLQAVAIVFAGDYYVNEPSSGGTKGSGYQETHWSDDDARSIGLRAAISTPIVDVVGGVEEHWFNERDSSVTSLGLRKRFEPESGEVLTYVQLLARHGRDIRTDVGREDYDGLSLGFGGIQPLNEHWFLDFGLEVEWALDPLEIRGDDDYLFAMMFNVGIGFSP